MCDCFLKSLRECTPASWQATKEREREREGPGVGFLLTFSFYFLFLLSDMFGNIFFTSGLVFLGSFSSS